MKLCLCDMLYIRDDVLKFKKLANCSTTGSDDDKNNGNGDTAVNTDFLNKVKGKTVYTDEGFTMEYATVSADGKKIESDKFNDIIFVKATSATEAKYQQMITADDVDTGNFTPFTIIQKWMLRLLTET